MNLRVFKKDIEYFVDLFLADCDLVMMLNPGLDANEILKIEDEAIDIYNSIRDRANRPEGKKKAFYNGLIEEMHNKLDELCEKLSKLVVAKEEK